MAGAKRKWEVLTSNGDTKQVEGTKAEINPASAEVVFYDGDDVVASFRGYQSFSPA